MSWHRRQSIIWNDVYVYQQIIDNINIKAALNGNCSYTPLIQMDEHQYNVMTLMKINVTEYHCRRWTNRNNICENENEQWHYAPLVETKTT